MTIMTSLSTRRGATHLWAARTGRPSAAPVTVSVRLLDGGAAGGQLSGPARHALEAHGELTSVQRLSLASPADLPRLYTQAEADVLVQALTAAGAVAVTAPCASL